MTDQEIPDDAIVRTALQLLPVPAHGDAFWADLERAIDAEAAPAPAAAADARRPVVVAAPVVATDPQVVDLEQDPLAPLVPPAFRRRSNAVLLAVAAAAVVVVSLAGNALLQEREGTDVATDDTTTEALDALVDDAQDDDASPPATLSADGEDASMEAVLAWVADLGAGDSGSAWQAMGQGSKEHFGSQSAFEGEMSALAEGYGAWSAATPDDVLVTPLEERDGGTLAIVTLIGTIEPEGKRERRADAFPVWIADGQVHLEPFALAGALEFVVPEALPGGGTPAPIGTTDELVIVVPADAEAPVIRLDDGAAMVCGEAEGTELTTLEGVSGQRCAYLPEGGLAPGTHTLTAAFLTADGHSVTAESLLFDAA